MSENKNKNHGYKNDVQPCTLGDIQALGDLPLSISETKKNTLMLTARKGVEHNGYKPVAKVQIFFARSKKWDQSERDAITKAYRPMFLRDLLPAGTQLEVSTSQPSEKYNSPGGTLQLRSEFKATVAGKDVHGSIVLSYAGSRDWPEQRPEAADEAEGSADEANA